MTTFPGVHVQVARQSFLDARLETGYPRFPLPTANLGSPPLPQVRLPMTPAVASTAMTTPPPTHFFASFVVKYDDPKNANVRPFLTTWPLQSKVFIPC